MPTPIVASVHLVGLEEAQAAGLMIVTSGDSATTSADIALKAASVEICLVERFSGTLIVYGELPRVETSVEAANQRLERTLGFRQAPITGA